MLNVTLTNESKQSREDLIIFPLLTEQTDPLPHQLLSETLATDSLNVLELEQAQVSNLIVENLAPNPVLILDGEQLLGAKQTRMVNRSVVVPGESKTEIPVSCVERGRWHFTTNRFSGGRHWSPSSVRRRARDLESKRVRMGVAAGPETLSATQGEIWSEIDKVQDAVGNYSPTGSLDEVSQSIEYNVLDWIEHFPLLDKQVGILALLNGAPLALDVIGSRDLYSRLHDRLIRGYILDALSQKYEAHCSGCAGCATCRQPLGVITRDVSRRRAKAFLAAVSDATHSQVPTPGIGSYSVLNSTVSGGKLEQHVDGVNRLIHMMAFPRYRS